MCVRSLRFWCVAVLALATSTASAQEAKTRKRPNVVFIITDDQGYGDLSCHGNPILKTPNLDALHKRSVRFVDFNVSPTCAPTRSSLMTGRHEFKSGITHTIHERERMSLRAFTLAQLLKQAGYTTGIFGKWHLGDEAAYRPDRRGFDETFIHGAGGIGQSYPGSCGDAPGNKYFDPAILHNGKFVKTKGYCTDVFFDEALRWMNAKRGGAEPFFCWIATNAPHAPLDVPAAYERRYADQVKPNVAKFFGMIANIDDNVGKLMAQLKAWGMDEDTLVIFMTDNGGTAGVQTFNAGMRGSKVTPYRGGVRVPFFVSWPKQLPQGVDVNALAAGVDVLPTFADLTGTPLPKDLKLDGRSLVPLLSDAKAAWADRTLITHVGRWEKGKAQDAKYAHIGVRTAQWRLVNSPGKKGGSAWELFDQQQDPGEKTDLSAKRPEVVRDLRSRFDAWWDEVTPLLENENVVIPQHNAFHVLYWAQFGGGPKK